jgi:predicted metal-dependent hydrolase
MQSSERPASQTPFDLPIRRDLKWDFSDVQLKFVSDDVLVNYLWTIASVSAPGIERFFVTALRPLAEKIADPKLKSDMENMLVQEAMHAATHARFNRALADKGLPLEQAAARVDHLLDWVAKNCTQRDMIGMVAAGEHLIYSFATLFLADESIRAAMSPAARRLFDYHMLEEAEHGAVAHDVYRYFCPDDYLHRLKTTLTSVLLLVRLAQTTLTTLIDEGDEEITWKNWARFCWYGLLKPGVFRLMAIRLAHYLSPLYPLSFEFGDRSAWAECEARLYRAQPAGRLH